MGQRNNVWHPSDSGVLPVAGDDGDPLVGHQARYGKQWVWVRLKLKTGDYLLSRGYGRTAEYWAKKASDFQVVDFPPVLQKA